MLGPSRSSASRCSGTRVALVGFEAVARAIQRQRAHQAVARHLGDDRGRRDRHARCRRRRSPRRSRRARRSCRGRRRTRAAASRAAPAPRAPAPTARRAGCCRDRSAPARQRRPQRTRRADLLEQFLAALGGQPLGIVDALGDSLRVEHHGGGHHRPRQRTAPGLVAAGHRPDAALDQRALAPKARRRDRDHALRQLGLLLAGLCSDFLADLSRIMPGWCAKPSRARATRKPAQFPLFRPHRNRARARLARTNSIAVRSASA